MLFHICPRNPVCARSESGSLLLWTCLSALAFPAQHFLVANVLLCCFVLEGREIDHVCRWGRALTAPTLAFLPAPSLLSWKLISEVEIRTVKGRKSWCGEIPGQIRETRSLTQIELLPQEWPYAGFYLEATLSISLPAFPCSWDTLSL